MQIKQQLDIIISELGLVDINNQNIQQVLRDTVNRLDSLSSISVRFLDASKKLVKQLQDLDKENLSPLIQKLKEASTHKLTTKTVYSFTVGRFVIIGQKQEHIKTDFFDTILGDFSLDETITTMLNIGEKKYQKIFNLQTKYLTNPSLIKPQRLKKLLKDRVLVQKMIQEDKSTDNLRIAVLFTQIFMNLSVANRGDKLDEFKYLISASLNDYNLQELTKIDLEILKIVS
ncbi:hypothetical protein DID75_01325 [Candidatus Marinamargulisbacteria bacterium SCGC AG-410-N11]|nr:hypothetical protein DID75_01325 [Candidatus Marinamargulisbacteria bacterium SCGC AG-410-N11]